jgi:hypothetical protein
LRTNRSVVAIRSATELPAPGPSARRPGSGPSSVSGPCCPLSYTFLPGRSGSAGPSSRWPCSAYRE